MNSSARLVLPALNYPFPAHIHPGEQRVEQGTFHWMQALGLLANPAMVRAVQYGRFGEFTSREYPTATDQGLQLITDIFGWLFALDDFIGDAGAFGNNPATLSRLHVWLREIMDNPTALDHASLGAEISRHFNVDEARLCRSIGLATVDIWRRLEALCSPAQYMRCVEAATYYFLGLIWEAGWHSVGSVPWPPEYLVGRRFTTATPFGLALQDVAAGYEVPADEYQRKDIRELNATVTRITALCNDIFSYPKERDEARVVSLNFPSVLIRCQGLEEQAALDEAARHHDELIDSYLTQERLAMQAASPQLRLFFQAMRAEMRGHYDWALHSPRYDLGRYFIGIARS